MATKKDSKGESRDSADYDLVASGSAGRWSIFVDESHSGPQQWFIQIKGPSIYFSFGIGSPQTIEKIVNFLTPKTARPSAKSIPAAEKLAGSLSIGKHKRFPVQLIRDTEYDDRYFLDCGTVGSSLVRYAVSGDDLQEWIDSFSQASAELSEQGLLCDERTREYAGATGP